MGERLLDKSVVQLFWQWILGCYHTGFFMIRYAITCLYTCIRPGAVIPF
jgi:hypothetical protein